MLFLNLELSKNTRSIAWKCQFERMLNRLFEWLMHSAAAAAVANTNFRFFFFSVLFFRCHSFSFINRYKFKHLIEKEESKETEQIQSFNSSSS